MQQARFCRQAQKPCCTLTLTILEPSRFAGHLLLSRLYCNPKALWKLNWFLRDFGYDAELLGRDEVDESQLAGLKGVVKISHIVFNGASLLRLDGFAPAGRWEELSPANLDGSWNGKRPEAGLSPQDSPFDEEACLQQAYEAMLKASLGFMFTMGARTTKLQCLSS